MARAARIRSQLGIEAIPAAGADNVPVAATVQLPGLLTMRHASNRLLREEYRNSWGGSNVHDDLRVESTGQYVGRCTSSTLIYWLSAAIRSNPTIAAISGGSSWTFNQPLTNAPIPPLQAYTAYWGDDDGGGGGGALCSAGVVVTRIVIEGADDAAWTVRVDLLGTGVIAGAFTSALTTITNETAKNLLSSIFFAADWAGLAGAAASTNLAYGFTWTYDAGIAGDFTMSNKLRRTDLHRDIPETTLQLRLKWTTVAAARAVDTVNLTRQYIRLLNTGTGPNFIDIAGSYAPMTFDSIADQRDGTTRATWDLVAVEDPAGGTPRKVEVKVGTAAGAL